MKGKLEQLTVNQRVNLAITPDRHLALAANSLEWVKDGDGCKETPDDKVYIIDLTASPPTQIGTVEAGKQASDIAITASGYWRWWPTARRIRLPC